MERKDIDIDDDEKEITQKQIKRQNINVDDEVYNNPNFHSKEQDELEIPDGFFFYILNYYHLFIYLSFYLGLFKH
ncbi:hypothetical protein RhiirA1_540632 [Rhizophagus irregularis]|uniref:Uncharacterized protein n=1 Tax=Rhizophagus irregularis TaxID=588596 RepID=A0A2N0R7A2_9GLOM|nr:hypothetical protein RhiirA1_540632 [Rhizophagus irregularis]